MKTLARRNSGLSLLPELPSLFNDPFFQDLFPWSNRSVGDTGTVPAINVQETENAYEISVAAPGMNKNDFKVELDNGRLVISAEHKQTDEKKDENYLRQEYSYQSFVRSFNLGERQVQGDKIQAKYTDGILHLTIPKSEEAKAKAPKVIPIS
jgi:HSP20 family protein